jgi:DNA helicase-2/ATP-dependent DNA helicase PcrA
LPNLPYFLQTLNENQLEAVRFIANPLLILAGAGTGKTRVIVSKIAYLIDSGVVSPSELLAVTFTNKAANEMNDRIFNHVSFKLPWVGTFHAMATKILRINSKELNLDPNFTILDYDDQLKLIKNIFTDQNLDKNDVNPKLILAIIQHWKDLALTPEKITNSDLSTPAHQLAQKIYSSYQFHLKKMDAVDFGDIILFNIILFKQSPNILEIYQNKFKFIFVDEYQDTNTAQYLWLRMLAQGNNKLCCVGDDDQSIYGWRGAKVGNILRFEHDFPGAKVIKLEQNYRSNKDILHAASTIIANNKSRYNKVLWTDISNSQKIIVKSCWNDKEEAGYVAQQIRNISLNEHVNYKEMAVLVRASFQTRVIEEIFISQSIPYKIIGGLKFYERQEIKDLLSYIKLIIRENDDISLERILNKPKRGIGKTSIEKIRQHANQHHISMFQAIIALTQIKSFSGKTNSELLQFINLIKKWQNDYQTLSLPEILNMVLKDSGYMEMLESEKSLEASARIENIDEFRQALSEYNTLTEFLEHISLVTDNDETFSDNVVSVMTLHAAKGLEFNTIFLPGWEEGLFPHSKSIEELGLNGLEEERRLAYVGITRAKERLCISHSAMRRMYNQFIDSQPSRFIKELPEESIVKLGFENAVSKLSFINNFVPRTIPAKNKINHQTFGTGYILADHGDLLEIKFENHGVKKILKRFVEFI